MTISPFETPEAFDFITIDGVKSPAKIVRTAINGRELEYDEQKSPLYRGVFTVIRNEKIVAMDYALEYWTDDEVKPVEDWQRMLRTHQRRKPVKPFRLIDPVLDGLDVASMWCPYVGSRFERVDGLQKWRLPFKCREFGPRKPIGGPLRDERNAGAINAARRNAEQAQREALENIAGYTKGMESGLPIIFGGK